MYIPNLWCRVGVSAAVLTLTLTLGHEARGQRISAEIVPMSLEQLLDSVYAASPALKSAQLDWVAKLERADEPSWPDPSVMFTWLPEPIYTARGAQTWQLRAEQRIPFPGKLRLQNEVAIEDAYVAQQRAAELELKLGYEVKRAFHRLRRIDGQERLTRDFAQRIKEFERAASGRYRVGAGSQQAIVKAQLEGNKLDNILLGLDKERIQTETLISRLRGDGLAVRIEPVDVPAWEPPPALDIDHLVQLAVSQRPDVRAIDASLRRSEHAEELARKQLWPDLGVGVTYFGINQADIPANSDGKDALALTASVQIPLFRSRQTAAIESEQVSQRSIEQRRQNAEITLRAEIIDILWRMERERERLNLIRHTLIPQAESTFDLALNGYTNGQLEFIDLLDAERGLFAIRNDLETAVESYNTSLAELELTLGVHSIAELEQHGLLVEKTGDNHE